MIPPLTHYVIVRRDLPFGVLCAQLTHAAGESFYRLHEVSPIICAGSSVSEQQHFSLQVGGSIPSPRSISNTIAVVLGARNEAALLKLERKLKYGSIAHVAIREPDPPWNGQLMAIGLMPQPRDDVRKYVERFQTIRHLQEPLF